MDRASDSGSEGWGFESLPACHEKSHICLLDKCGIFRTKCSASAEREVCFASEAHCVREVCLRHDRRRNTSLHIVRGTMLHSGSAGAEEQVCTHLVVPRRGHVPALHYKSVRDARYSPEGRIPYSLFPIHYSLFPIPPFPLPLFLFSQKTGGKTAGICLLSLGKSVDETEKICYNMY